MPRLLAGEPAGDTDTYVVWQEGDVRVFHPARLTPKYGQDRIRIRLKGFLFIRWLDLEGARAIVSAPADQAV